MNYTFDENIVSDLYKDAYGFRPRDAFWNNWEQMSVDEKQAEWDFLLAELEREMEREADAKVAAVEAWDKSVRKVSDTLGVSKLDVIRWLWDAEGISEPNSQDIESFVWEHGILHTDTGREVVRMLTNILKPEY